MQIKHIQHNLQTSSCFEQWRREKFGWELEMSTVNTCNSAFILLLYIAGSRGYMQKTQEPVPKNFGKASMWRVDFSTKD